MLKRLNGPAVTNATNRQDREEARGATDACTINRRPQIGIDLEGEPNGVVVTAGE